jgi:hypothetical protein
MEDKELRYLASYAHRINDAGGDLSTLTEEERKHLKKLVQKYQIEQDLAEIAEKLGQGRLFQ